MVGDRNAAPVNAEREQVKFLLALKGYSSADVARMAGASPSMVCAVLCGRRHSQGIENLIASIVGKSRSELWPSRAYLFSKD